MAGLKPSTPYILQCTAIPDDIHLNANRSKIIPFITGEGIDFLLFSWIAFFQIRQIYRWRRRVTYHVASNVNAPIACFIMTKKRMILNRIMNIAEILDTYESSTSNKQRIVFAVPSASIPLLTKCEMYDSSNTST